MENGIQTGDRVRVIGGDAYRACYIGFVGEVRHVNNGIAEVRLDSGAYLDFRLKWLEKADKKAEFLRDFAEFLKRHNAVIHGFDLHAKINGETLDFGGVEYLDADCIMKCDK